MNAEPSVSVVIVNLNGRVLLGQCLDGLATQSYPQDKVETILVDNGSTDDSVVFVREMYPHVHVIEAGRNLGFAGGNNLGVRIATGDYVALINNDARADPHWLRAMVDVLERDPEVACAASKILDEKGETIDFVGPVMNLYGRAFQIDEGVPAVPGFYDEPRELLAPCGGAMMVRRDVFLPVGGFDEDYVAWFEDLDLGWRFWLYGYRVLLVPQAIVYHRQHQTGSKFPVEQRYVLSEMNALRTVVKNYEEENLWRVLPFSLFMGVKRALEQAGLNREQYMLGYPRSGDSQAGVFESEPRMTRVATSFLVAIDQVANEMPRILEKRRRIQAARVRSDEEIFARFPMRPDNWLFSWRGYHAVQDQLVKDLGVPSVLQPRHGSRLLVVTHETIGTKMAGPGIRAWEIACTLSEQFDVTLAAPGKPERSYPGLRVVGYEMDAPDYSGLNPHVNSADVVLAMGSLFTEIPRLQHLSKPAIVDLYDPRELEKLAESLTIQEQYHLGIDLESMLHLRLEGAAGDFFICANERQRDFWLGALLAAGRINTLTYAQDPTLRNLIDVVPFGMPSLPPQKQRNVLKGVHSGIEPQDKVLFWNGGLWQWFDPLTLVDALVEVLRTRTDVKLYFAAGYHFNLETVPEMPIYERVVERCRELDLLDRHVFFGDWIPYDERGDYLLEADLSVSTHLPTLESQFSSRTRLLDCIWAGLPIISNDGDPLSDVIVEHELGRVIPSGRPVLLARAILEMLADDGLRDRVTERAQAVRDELTWERAVEPIAAFLERVAFAPDALDAARRAAQARQTTVHLQRLEEQASALKDEVFQLRRDKQALSDYVEELLAHIQAIRQGRVMRLMNRIDKILGRGE
jgi:GT2 family glycosyltransferase/glycosyltransferase involved in cell wall biosynthesis